MSQEKSTVASASQARQPGLHPDGGGLYLQVTEGNEKGKRPGRERQMDTSCLRLAARTGTNPSTIDRLGSSNGRDHEDPPAPRRSDWSNFLVGLSAGSMRSSGGSHVVHIIVRGAYDGRRRPVQSLVRTSC
jgi:hypothetical protein